MRFQLLISALALCAISASAENDALDVLTTNSETFLTNLYKELASKNEKKNLISSPLSVHVALSMTAYGAANDTATLMRQALNLPTNDSLAFEGFRQLDAEFRNIQNGTLDIANKLYVGRNAVLKKEYLDLTSSVFNAQADTLDTKDPVAAAKAVNDWVAQKTHDKITDLLDASSISEDTRLILLNAIYFKAEWARAFNADKTKNKPFYTSTGKKLLVPTMTTTGYYICGRFPDLAATYVEIPYKNEDLVMVLIVPDKADGLSKVEQNLELFNYSTRAGLAVEQEIKLYLPKFKIESTIGLNDPLAKLNLENIFSDEANFSGISDEPLKVDEVKQKAFIEVTEQGTEAAAATDIILVAKASFNYEPLKFTVDRPFHFLIRKSRTTLFQGHIYNPLL